MRSYQLHKVFLGLTLLTDVAVILGSFFFAWWLRFGSGWIDFTPPAPAIQAYLRGLPFMLAVYLLVFNYAGLYQRRWSVVGTGELSAIARAVAVGSLLIFALGFMYRGFSYSRLVLAIMAVSNVMLLRLGRGILHGVQEWLRRQGVGIIRVAIVGDGAEAQEVAAVLNRHPDYGFQVVGFIGKGSAGRGLKPRLGGLKDLEAIVKKKRVDEVLLAPRRSVSRSLLADCVLRCRALGVDCRLLADVFGILTSRVTLDDLFGLPMLSLDPHPLVSWSSRALKRTLDVVLALLALLVLAPVMLLVAVIIKLDSAGSVLYLQERTGRDGRPFGMLKFRSMRADAERTTGPVWAGQHDPRRTRVGGFLRRTSIDELPQLINVLLGEMSLVGPRPERPHFVREFSRKVPRYLERHDVAPGITGWAQVNGLRGNTSVEERTRYDLFYIENWSVWLDLKILFRTAMEVFHHQEAY